MRQPPTDRAAGFTLVEMIVSITLLSILATVAVPMLRLPMSAYLESTSRAAMTSELDVARQKIADDLSRALPGSVRVVQTGTGWLVEYLEVRAHGRFRNGNGFEPGGPYCPNSPGCGGAPNTRDKLNTTCNDTCFTSLGPVVLLGGTPSVGSDYVVIEPQVASPYTGGSAQVVGGSKARLTGYATVGPGALANRRVTFNAQRFPSLPAGSSKRFYVVSTPVTYECNSVTRQLRRHANYAVSATQPTTFAGAQTDQLASMVSACGSPTAPVPQLVSNAGFAGGSVLAFWLRFEDTPPGGVRQRVELAFTQPVSEALL